jgi:hypothetical protein
MTQQIPGVPDGWELVRIDRPTKGDWFIDGYGNPDECMYDSGGGGVFPVIRKIEKTARYRQFANAGEYLPHWGKPVRLKGGVGFDSVVSTRSLGVYIATGAATMEISMEGAFKIFEFADGTPFGVRIDE